LYMYMYVQMVRLSPWLGWPRKWLDSHHGSGDHVNG
jgi:hypothetical protein